MAERLINSAWRFVLMSLIFVLGASAMFQLYQGVLNLLGGRWEAGITPVVAGAILSGAIYWLANHREELVEF
jgi:hypothetical protein